MASLTLVVVVHDHQPVGNLEDVFVKAMDRAYRPFLAFLERHPGFRIALHTSGSLLEWMEAHDADYLRRVKALAARGQIELWGGAFYEPILPAIPEADRQGQIRALAGWLDRSLGARPRGAWVAERVWEPALAGSLADAGVDYTALDDAHFVATGLEREELFGYYFTEDQGKKLAVFPIHRELRYLAPFRPPEETIDWMRRVAEGGAHRMVVLGDDGEKFGLWPGTFERCYAEGWLEAWWKAIEDSGFVTLRTPAEAIAAHRPQGLVYLPSAAYHEMGEWSLPPAGQERMARARALLEPTFGEAAADLLRGGHWRSFLHRYPEANRVHKRTLRVSERLASHPRPDDEAWRQARTHLWRAQCNCPYWHGVFGGLYLPHLRAAVQRELIAAERALSGEGAHGEQGDIDFDGADEVLLESPALAAWVAPAQGGALFALDDRERLHAYGDTLARRPEAYHAKMKEAQVGGGEGETIHAAIRVKESGLLRMLRYDTLPRFSFLDRFDQGPGSPPDSALELARKAYRVTGQRGVALELVCEPGPHDPPLRVEKHYALEGSRHERLVVRYRLSVTGDRPVQGQFTVECNWALQVPAAPDRYVLVDGVRATPPEFAAEAQHAGCRSTDFVDEWAERRLAMRWSEPASLRRAPVETVSLSESGVERVFQALETRLIWPVQLAPGAPWALELTLEPGPASVTRR